MMIPEKSMIPETQKMNILSNDLVRRISNMKLEQAEEGEVMRIVDQYTGQPKTSEYGKSSHSLTCWKDEEEEEEVRARNRSL